MRKLISLLIFLPYFFVGCSKTDKPKSTNTKQSLSGNIAVIADTIVYDVILRNIDTSDVWEAECVQYVDQKSFIDFLFEGIYNNKFFAVEFMGDKILSIDDVKSLEKSEGFSRKLVSKVQFKERWYIDTLGNFQKQIISYTLGIEAYSKQNSFLGHKALFVVKPKL